MTLKKTFGRLGAILLASTVGFMPLEKVYSQDELEIVDSYEIKIGENHVKFVQGLYKTKMLIDRIPRKVTASKNILTITKPSGTILVYTDYHRDGKLDRVEIIKKGKKEVYYHGVPEYWPVMNEAQEQFDFYMGRINEVRLKETFE